ncbi:ABC transporter permease [Microbacterium sp. NPDC089695]|uniref:ABC transporter permease n=1 Tax=Microbacterium sp. NPDC089695 TaxID=3364198 RepID=UPI00381BA7B6
MMHVVIRRLLWTVPLLLAVSLLTFLLASLAPGSPAETMLTGGGGGATPEEIAALNRELGLDRPVLVQYWSWLTGALTGDLGVSIYTGQAVGLIIQSRLPITLSLTLLTLVLVIVVGISLGVLAAIRGGALAQILEVGAVLLRSIPNFWLAIVLVAVFGAQLMWFPVSGYVDFATSPELWLSSLVLPVLALALGEIALVAIITRAEMQNAMRSDFVRGLRANGIPGARIVFAHVLRNAASPVLTILSLTVVGLMGGTILMEQVFGMAGLGAQMVKSVSQHDLPVLQGLVVFYTLIVVVVFLVNDLASAYLNPKVRTR